MNDSNQTLRFSRSYTEATGRRLHRSDFDPPAPGIQGRDVVFWIGAVLILAGVVAVLAR